MPYLTALLGWAGGGGASSAGLAALDDLAAHPEVGAGGDWLEFVLGVTGAASFIDLPVRAVLLGIGARGRHMRIVVAAWVVFSAVLFGVSFLDLAPIRWLYVVTFPWLVHHRPPQMVVLFASLLIASGLATSVGWLWSLRPRLARHPHAWRRLAVAGGILLAFFAEGSAISIYKTLDQVIVEQNAYSPDDAAAMAWLKQHAQPGELIVNDQAADAGIWAPYKAGVPILLPRSASGPLVAERTPVLTHLLDLLRALQPPRAEACGLHVDLRLLPGARPVPATTTSSPPGQHSTTPPTWKKSSPQARRPSFASTWPASNRQPQNRPRLLATGACVTTRWRSRRRAWRVLSGGGRWRACRRRRC